MKKISFMKIALVVLVIAILGLGLSGCLTPPIITTGTAKLVVSGTYYYNLKMDGTTYHFNKPSGTYYITDVPAGNHFFEAVDTWGASYGYDSTTEYIAAGTTTTIYLNPIAATGTLKVTIMDDPGYKYYVYLGTSASGQYLGTTTGSNIYGANLLTVSGIPTGNQSIYVISEDGVYYKVSSIYINPNTTNILNIWILP